MFHPLLPAMFPSQIFPGFFPASAPLGVMPTAEQREEFSLAVLNDQKQQIAQTRQFIQDYLKSVQEHLKSLDSSLEAIDKEIASVNEARTRRQGASAAGVANPSTKSTKGGL
jgi:hypothetical protein